MFGHFPELRTGGLGETPQFSYFRLVESPYQLTDHRLGFVPVWIRERDAEKCGRRAPVERFGTDDHGYIAAHFAHSLCEGLPLPLATVEIEFGVGDDLPQVLRAEDPPLQTLDVFTRGFGGRGGKPMLRADWWGERHGHR